MSGSSSNSHLHLLDLPNEMLQEIMSYLTYDEIAKCRAVCKKFDQNNRQMLNRGYQLITSRLEKYANEIRSTLPRRGAALHPRLKHYAASIGIKHDLYTLERCYHPYIETGVSCFIAGKVIDQAFKAFHSIKTTEILTPLHQLTKDLTTNVEMAMDHFQDVVEPTLQNMSDIKELARDRDDFEISSSEILENSTSKSDFLSEPTEQLRKSLESLHYRVAKNRVAVLHLKKQISKIRLKVDEKPSRMRLQILKLQQQNWKKGKQLKKLRKRIQHGRRNCVCTEK